MRNSTFNVLLNVLIIVDNIFITFAILDYACVRGNTEEKAGDRFVRVDDDDKVSLYFDISPHS